MMVPMWDKEVKLDNSKSKEILKIKYTENFDKVLTDMGYSLIESGVCPDKRKKK